MRHHFVASLALVEGPARCRAAEELTFRLRAENTGLARWPARGEPAADDRGAVHLGSHLLRDDEDEVAWDYARARLPRDIEPGEAVELAVMVRAPERPGRYVVEFDMLAEHVSWFEDFGSGTLRHEIVVE
ncbi:MAG: hypothetical protein LC802_19610 [Acidobacteria bacterium]|nr:hypothetical protein [Acidobacteriota bacterium]